MASKIPFKINKAGRWISSTTGRFAKKVDYMPYLEKKLEADAARAAGVKDYWSAVKVVMKVNKITNVKEGRSKLIEEIDQLKQMYSIGKKFTSDPKTQKQYTIRDDKHARKLLMTTEKYTNDSKKASYNRVWKQLREQKATREQRKQVFSALEQDAYELIS